MQRRDQLDANLERVTVIVGRTDSDRDPGRHRTDQHQGGKATPRHELAEHDAVRQACGTQWGDRAAHRRSTR